MMSSSERVIYRVDQIALNIGSGAAAALAGGVASGLSPKAAEAVERLRSGAAGLQSRATVFNAADEVGRSDAG